MSKYSSVIQLLKKAKNVAIFMHINPDCDCIGSAIALSRFLKNDGKSASFFSPDLTSSNMISEKYAFLPFFNDFNKTDDLDFDLAIAVDTGDVGRLGDAAFRKFVKIKQNAVIDHHEIFENFSKNVIREHNSASTTQILFKIMCEYDKSLIDKDIATLLYAGLVTDSGGFTFECCSEETYRTAAELVSFGINHSDICNRLLKNTARNVFFLRNKILSRTKFYENGRLGIIVFRKDDFEETGTTDADTDGIINYVRDVEGVDLAVSIAETGDKKYKVSFRSTEKVNAAYCARCFGGGGHARAAGCRIYGYFDDAYNKILDAMKEMLNDD